MKKKLLSALMAVVLLLSLTACGGSDSDFDSEKGEMNRMEVYKFEVQGSEPIALGTPEKKVDAASVYANLTYTPEMFYGRYHLYGGDKAEEEFGNAAKYATFTYDGRDVELSVLPIQLTAGPHSLNHVINSVEGYNWVRAAFLKKTDSGNYYDDYLCAYSVEGNTLTLKPLNKYEYDDSTKKITYAFSETEWKYTFKFEGFKLTLTSGDESITLHTGTLASKDSVYIQVYNYASDEKKTIDNIDYFGINYEEGEDLDETTFFLHLTDDYSHFQKTFGRLTKQGVFTFSAGFETGIKTYEFVFFYCDDDGIILADGENTYYYNATYSDRNWEKVNNYISEDQTAKFEELPEEKIEDIVETTENLMDDLTKAFNDAGINVAVDTKTGELAMDATILFGGDSSELTEEGQEFLKKFITAYTNIIFNEKYSGFVQKTIIEGHTAPTANSTYESGLPLSEERANKVKDFCLSEQSGVDVSKLESTLEAIGYSNSKPIYDENGEIDKDACRRVAFRFIINLD